MGSERPWSERRLVLPAPETIDCEIERAQVWNVVLAFLAGVVVALVLLSAAFVLRSTADRPFVQAEP